MNFVLEVSQGQGQSSRIPFLTPSHQVFQVSSVNPISTNQYIISFYDVHRHAMLDQTSITIHCYVQHVLRKYKERVYPNYLNLRFLIAKLTN